MSREETQRAILNSEQFWGLPTSSSWPDCGAIPNPELSDIGGEIDEGTHRVIAYSDIAGPQFIDRLEGESFPDFKARIDIIMNTPPSTPETTS